MTIFMISDLKQQKIGFQEKIAFIKRCLKKHIYNPIRTRLHFPITFNNFLYNVQLFEKFKLDEMLHMYWETYFWITNETYKKV